MRIKYPSNILTIPSNLIEVYQLELPTLFTDSPGHSPGYFLSHGTTLHRSHDTKLIMWLCFLLHTAHTHTHMVYTEAKLVVGEGGREGGPRALWFVCVSQCNCVYTAIECLYMLWWWVVYIGNSLSLCPPTIHSPEL